MKKDRLTEEEFRERRDFIRGELKESWEDYWARAYGEGVRSEEEARFNWLVGRLAALTVVLEEEGILKREEEEQKP